MLTSENNLLGFLEWKYVTNRLRMLVATRQKEEMDIPNQKEVFKYILKETRTKWNDYKSIFCC